MKHVMLERLQERFAELVRRYIREVGTTQGELAGQVGMHRTHLNALLNGRMPLSGHYLDGFIRRGIVMVDEIYDGQEETARERDFWTWARLSQDDATKAEIIELQRNTDDLKGLVRLINEYKRRGIDVESLLRAAIKQP